MKPVIIIIIQRKGCLMNASELSEEILLAALNYTRAGVIITDPSQKDNPILFANEGFISMTGYSTEEVIGRNCRFLQGAETNEEAVNELRKAVQDKQSLYVEILNYRKDGSSFWNGLSVDPLYIASEQKHYFVGVQKDITQRKCAEENFKNALSEIEDLSCPIVPLMRDIAVLPLIGKMNERRFRIVNTGASDYVSTHSIKKLVVDLSGLVSASQQDFEGIVKLSGILRLMGTEMVLTGVTVQTAKMAIVSEQLLPADIRVATTIKRLLEELI